MGGPIIGIWLFPIIVYLPVAVVVTRSIYKKSGNPYLGGIINGIHYCGDILYQYPDILNLSGSIELHTAAR